MAKVNTLNLTHLKKAMMKSLLTLKRLVRSNIPLYFIRILLLLTVIYFALIIYKSVSVGNCDGLQSALHQTSKSSSDSIKYRKSSHTLENLCKYPVLIPNDETIKDFIHHPRTINCMKVQEDYVIFDEETSKISINQDLAKKILGVQLVCVYRPFAGTLKPEFSKIVPTKHWTIISEKNLIIKDDQFEVKCFSKNDSSASSTVYRFAFSQVVPISDKQYSKNTDTQLSVDMIVLDSTSLNMFRRHMPKTLDYMTKEMQFFFFEAAQTMYHLKAEEKMNKIMYNSQKRVRNSFENLLPELLCHLVQQVGYNKVADNSMVNLLPVLAGKRYLDASYKDHKLPSDLPENAVLDMDSIPFIWKDFSAKNCSTMFNDDVMHHTRGLFHYPWNIARGFKIKPTDYFYRPWHVWQRLNAIKNSSAFCFGNLPQPRLQLQLIKQMIKLYRNKCHFSFSFFTDVPHDVPSNLERMDDDLYEFLETYHEKNYLNKTVLIIMGDHGQRISGIQWRFVGRIEERMPLFSVYFPKWFRELHPDIMNNLYINKYRLTSNYDVYKMLKDIVDEYFDGTNRDQDLLKTKGQSLFTEISSNRNCMDANIPDNHCTCLEKVVTVNSPKSLYDKCVQFVFNFTTEVLKPYDECLKVSSIIIDQISTYTTNDMVKHGIRAPDSNQLINMNSTFDNQIEYVEMTYKMVPIDIWAKVRLQHSKKQNKLFINSGPLVLNSNSTSLCLTLKNPPNFCLC